MFSSSYISVFGSRILQSPAAVAVYAVISLVALAMVVFFCLKFFRRLRFKILGRDGARSQEITPFPVGEHGSTGQNREVFLSGAQTGEPADSSESPPSYTDHLPPYGTETIAATSSEVAVSEALATASASPSSRRIFHWQEKSALHS